MADRDAAGTGADPTFAWHPDYAGKRASEVRAAIEADLRSDQRAYALALSGADEHESDALQSTIALDRKWGPFDLDWAETDPFALADRIVAFERERERRRELISYAAWRDAATAAVQPAAAAASRQTAPIQRAAPPTWVMAVVVVAIVVLLVLLLVGR